MKNNVLLAVKFLIVIAILIVFSLNTTILAQMPAMMNGGCDVDMEELMSLLMEDSDALENSRGIVDQYKDNGYMLYTAHFLDQEPFWAQGMMGQ